MIWTHPHLAAATAALPLAVSLLLPPAAKAQVVIGNSVFPRAGDTLHYALDRNPGPAISVTPPGGFQVWDFSSLKPQTTWVETLRPAAGSAGAEFFPNATLVLQQTGPASVNFPLLPGSNGSEALLQVTDNAVKLLGFHGGSDPGHLGVGAYVKVEPACAPPNKPGCGDNDLRTAFMTRFDVPLDLSWAPKQFFDVRQTNSQFDEVYAPVPLPGLPQGSYFGLRVRSQMSSTTAVDGFGTLMLPGGSFEVLREKSRTWVDLRLDAWVWIQELAGIGQWVELTTEQALSAIPDVRWGTWEQYTYRYSEAISKESLAITYSPIALLDMGDSLAIEQVQFKNLAPVPEPQTVWLMLLGMAGLGGLRRMAQKA